MNTRWPARPVWLLIGVSGLGGAVGVAVLISLYFLIAAGGSTGSELFALYALVAGLILAVPAGIGVSCAGAVGRLLGMRVHHAAAGALVGALVPAAAIASLLLFTHDPFPAFLVIVAAAGSAAAAVVFFFEVRWHAAARAALAQITV